MTWRVLAWGLLVKRYCDHDNGFMFFLVPVVCCDRVMRVLHERVHACAYDSVTTYHTAASKTNMQECESQTKRRVLSQQGAHTHTHTPVSSVTALVGFGKRCGVETASSRAFCRLGFWAQI